MTTEEKAKAYDLAIEKLRNAFYDNNSRMCEEYRQAVIRIIEPIFPEFKESEDEKIRQSLISYLHGLGEFEYPDKETYNNWLTWLEKQGEQTLAWSEEDEEIYSRICYLIHSAAFENYDVDEVGKELGKYAKITDWLKTIKTRCTWKPSDEQIDALEQFISEYKDIDDNSRAYPISHNIESLYNNLKKLKGK